MLFLLFNLTHIPSKFSTFLFKISITKGSTKEYVIKVTEILNDPIVFLGKLRTVDCIRVIAFQHVTSIVTA